MSDSDAQDRWVEQVLGFNVAAAKRAKGQAGAAASVGASADQPKAPAPKTISAPKLTSLWQRACEDVADQVEGLRRHIAQFDDPKLALIGTHAEAAVRGVIDGKLAAMLAEAEPFDEPRTKKLMSEIARSESAISGNRLIKLLDGNPFGAKLSIGATLGGALQAMTASLQTS